MPDNSVLGLTELTSLQKTDWIYVIRENLVDPTNQDFKAKLSTVETLNETLTSIEVSASGAVPLNKDMILLNNASLSLFNLTLADGTEGQEILFVSKTMTSGVTVTPTNFISNSFTFTLSGQSIKLKFIGTDWFIISNYNTTVN